MDKAAKRSTDCATQEMLRLAEAEGIELSWDRFDAMQPQCGYGQLGVCCRNCEMGPCRIDPFGEGPQHGVCGASAGVIVARNLLRKTAVGAAAHSDHGRDIAFALLGASRGTAEGYSVKDPEKLKRLAKEFGIATEGRETNQIAEKVALTVLGEFGRQEGHLKYTERAPAKLQAKWDAAGVRPRGVDRDVVTALHSTHIGVDNDPAHIINSCVRVSLSDGWGGSMMATELSDVLFGGPTWVRSMANLGVLKKDQVNVVVHGHEPTLSDAIVAASQTPEIQEACRKVGAKGLQLSGICCTANEILMRHGIPLAGNLLHQEAAILTGAVDMMVVDVQCIFPGAAQVAKHYHTKMISTSPTAKFEGVEHVEFDEHKALASAKQLLKLAIENYPKRDAARVHIPQVTEDLVAGFTVENTFKMLGGRYRPSFRPLNNAIADGRIRGVAGVIGCNNVRIRHDEAHLAMVRELLRHDVLVVQTGCSAIACGKAGLLLPEAASRFAGYGLLEVCEAVGMPPVLHLGSCVDNSRILMACVEMCRQGGLGDDLSDLPVAGAAPEWMSEKAISIGFYVVASGVYTVIADPLPVLGSAEVTRIVTEDLEKSFGGKFAFERDPAKAAHLMIAHMDGKRKALGLSKMIYQPRDEKTLGKAVSVEELSAAGGA
jgi:carbon-monoxide dehydrogenase catalytic subunit